MPKKFIVKTMSGSLYELFPGSVDNHLVLFAKDLQTSEILVVWFFGEERKPTTWAKAQGQSDSYTLASGETLSSDKLLSHSVENAVLESQLQDGSCKGKRMFLMRQGSVAAVRAGVAREVDKKATSPIAEIYMMLH